MAASASTPFSLRLQLAAPSPSPPPHTPYTTIFCPPPTAGKPKTPANASQLVSPPVVMSPPPPSIDAGPVATSPEISPSTGTPFVKRCTDAKLVLQVVQYIPYDTLSSQLLTHPPERPTDHGTVSLIVERPALNVRHVVQQAQLSIPLGMHGSGWEEEPGRGHADQICVMGTSEIRIVTNSDDPTVWAEAGDQMFFDFDLSKSNLATGDRVALGQVDDKCVVLEVTPMPHVGCPKFSKRFGKDALRVVNGPSGRRMRLRGIYFRVVRGGVVRTGDAIAKVAGDFGDAE